MTFVEFFSILTQAAFLCVAVFVVIHAVRWPTHSNLHALLFFALLALIVSFSWVQFVTQVLPDMVGEVFTPALIFTLPYVLLRLAHQYTSIKPLVMRIAEFGLILALAILIWPGIEHVLMLLAVVTYFVAVNAYSAYQFHNGAREANGITRKRLNAIALATVALSVGLFTVVFTAILEGPVSSAIEIGRQVLFLGSALLYLTGFAPPAVLRQAWQEPEIRRFLRRTLELPRMESEQNALRRIEEATAETIGAPHAVIGLWNAESGLIDFPRYSFKPGKTIGGRAFTESRPILSLDTVRDDPEHQEIYEKGNAFAVMAAPIQWDGETLGVIALHSAHAPVFAEDDLALLQLLADQIGILLQNRRHLEAQAELAAREETTRLKDEFLSVAAHDLKTPLTTILATGQYLERRLSRLNEETPELQSVARLNRESRRLHSFVQGLLDASRIEQGKILSTVEPTDVSELIQEVVERVKMSGSHRFEIDIADNLIADVDQVRFQQVIENLLENARKYSPVDSLISLRAYSEDSEIRISVQDQGTGIHPDDQDRVFDRYFRSSQADNGDAPGIGLGLYICKAIVLQHGGSIWVESKLGVGSTFYVSFRRSALSTVEHVSVDTRR